MGRQPGANAGQSRKHSQSAVKLAVKASILKGYMRGPLLRVNDIKADSDRVEAEVNKAKPVASPEPSIK